MSWPTILVSPVGGQHSERLRPCQINSWFEWSLSYYVCILMWQFIFYIMALLSNHWAPKYIITDYRICFYYCCYKGNIFFFAMSLISAYLQHFNKPVVVGHESLWIIGVLSLCCTHCTTNTARPCQRPASLCCYSCGTNPSQWWDSLQEVGLYLEGWCREKHVPLHICKMKEVIVHFSRKQQRRYHPLDILLFSCYWLQVQKHISLCNVPCITVPVTNIFEHFLLAGSRW